MPVHVQHWLSFTAIDRLTLEMRELLGQLLPVVDELLLVLTRLLHVDDDVELLVEQLDDARALRLALVAILLAAVLERLALFEQVLVQSLAQRRSLLVLTL